MLFILKDFIDCTDVIKSFDAEKLVRCSKSLNEGISCMDLVEVTSFEEYFIKFTDVSKAFKGEACASCGGGTVMVTFEEVVKSAGILVFFSIEELTI